MSVKFGTSGLRGLVAEMTDPVCEAHVRAFLAHLRAAGAAPGEVLVGRDLRPSSPRIAAACRRAMRAEGMTAIGCGVVPTPALALEAARRGAAAVMVTGSHIPFDRNGLKFYLPGRRGDQQGATRRGSSRRSPRRGRRAAGGGPRRSGRRRALRGARRSTSSAGGASAGFASASTSTAPPGASTCGAALDALGAEVVRARAERQLRADRHRGDPARARRSASAGGWREHRLAALVSTDGDGDRPLVADETGRVLRGDALGALAARLLGADAVAAPLNASTALEGSGWFARVAPHADRLAARHRGDGAAEGGGCAAGRRLRGERRVPARRHGGLAGGAAAGGAADPRRDGAGAGAPRGGGARRAAALGAGGDLPARATDSGRLAEVDVAAAARLLDGLAGGEEARAALLSRLAAGDLVATDTLDGVRMRLGSGEIVHLRLSGNAPELRCYTEAATPERAAELLAGARARGADAACRAPRPSRARGARRRSSGRCRRPAQGRRPRP